MEMSSGHLGNTLSDHPTSRFPSTHYGISPTGFHKADIIFHRNIEIRQVLHTINLKGIETWSSHISIHLEFVSYLFELSISK